jgi:UDP-N-acetylglucosamine 2-epimerase (non-hydrolysing)
MPPLLGAPLRLSCIAGTRPECLKLASVIAMASNSSEIDLQVVSSGQHPHMVASTLEQLGLPLYASLPPIPKGTHLSKSVQHLRKNLRQWLQHHQPDVVLVQGDTSTAYAGALAAAECRLPIAHLEAGLRTATPMRPFPEEVFRRRITPLARWHFAPTVTAGVHLQHEGIAPEQIHVVGNSIIDLLRTTCAAQQFHDLEWRSRGSHLLVLTLHRRENYQQGLVNVCASMLDLLEQDPELCVLCPVHPNPVVGTRIRRLLGQHPRVLLTEPLPYRRFIALLQQASLIVTDSGGIQEEAPYLGTPVLVTRSETERPECLQGGLVQLVGNQRANLLQHCLQVLSAARPLACGFNEQAPFGAGRTAEQVLAVLKAAQSTRMIAA